MEAYSYMSSGGGMILLLLILGAVITYLLFSKGFWLDKYCKDERKSWDGEDVEPDYNTNQKIHDAISFDRAVKSGQEVPNRPSKKRKRKTAPKKRTRSKQKK
jgi:hypothetical protein